MNLFKERFCDIDLDLQNLISVCTNGALSMKVHYLSTNEHKGFVALLQKEIPNLDALNLFIAFYFNKTCVLNFRYSVAHQKEQ